MKKDFIIEKTAERKAFRNYPDQRLPITPQEIRNAETKKDILIEFALQWKEKAVKANKVQQAETFEKIANYLGEITDPYWFLELPRSWGAKEILREVSKKI